MICPSCGGELYQFQAGLGVKAVPAEELPTACRRCGQIALAGKPFVFPEGFQERVAALVDDLAKQESSEARKSILTDPQTRIDAYFNRVYKRGYFDGFMRALAYFQHHAKEGRLVRLRKLWSRFKRSPSAGGIVVEMTKAEYTEFDQLLHLGVVEVPHVEGPSHGHQAG
jgi:hypothetical protein